MDAEILTPEEKKEFAIGGWLALRQSIFNLGSVKQLIKDETIRKKVSLIQTQLINLGIDLHGYSDALRCRPLIQEHEREFL